PGDVSGTMAVSRAGLHDPILAAVDPRTLGARRARSNSLRRYRSVDYLKQKRSRHDTRHDAPSRSAAPEESARIGPDVSPAACGGNELIPHQLCAGSELGRADRGLGGPTPGSGAPLVQSTAGQAATSFRHR